MRIVGLAALLAVIGVFSTGAPPARAEALTITVTSAADVLESAVCPSETSCTLRAAVTAVNADAGEGPYVIAFDPGIFPPGAPLAITLGTDLPAIARDGVTVSGTGAGVIIQGSGTAGVGLRFDGADAAVRGLHIQTLLSACVVVTGARATVGGDPLAGEGNTLGGCVVGVLSTGADAAVDGNIIGWRQDGAAGTNSTGIDTSGTGAAIGTSFPNAVGNAQTGVFSTGEAVVVEENVVGMDTDGVPAPVGIGISTFGPGAVVGNAADPAASNLVGNAETGIRVGGTAAQLFGNVVGFTQTGEAAPVEVGVDVVGDGAVVGQHGSPARGNTAGNAGTGFRLAGEGAVLRGNTAGIAPDGSPAPVDVGFAIEAAGVLLGDDEEPDDANTAGNALTGIRVGTGDEAAGVFEGVRLERNWVGQTAEGDPHPVGAGIEVTQPSAGTAILGNRIGNTSGAGITLAGADEGPHTSAFIDHNVYGTIGTLSIDLLGDGMRNANDAGDADTGPNGLLNHPVILVATQGELSGTTGPLCVGGQGLCTVTFYYVEHEPGGEEDFATTPVSLGQTSTKPDGSFELPNPPIAPGKWIAATVSLGQLITSEFGPSARVGNGSVACGNVQLYYGWNHAPFFGAAPYTLGFTFPGSENDVSAIYELEDGTAGYKAWFADTLAGRTLFTLVPGAPYWYHANTNTMLGGGFTVTQPVQVALEEGWNDFVYLGATTDVEDALASISGKYTSVYRYVNDGFTESWDVFGGAGAPAYVRDFATMDACSSYWVFVTEDTTLIPPHP